MKKYTTRVQLRGYGLSRYQAIALTKPLSPIGKEKRLNAYSLSDVIGAIRKRLAERRITPKTRQALEEVLGMLIERLGNVVSVPFKKGGDASSREAFHALMDLSEFEGDIKATVATLRGKRHG